MFTFRSSLSHKENLGKQRLLEVVWTVRWLIAWLQLRKFVKCIYHRIFATIELRNWRKVFTFHSSLSRKENLATALVGRIIWETGIVGSCMDSALANGLATFMKIRLVQLPLKRGHNRKQNPAERL